MRNLIESESALRDLLSQRILVLDGAMGTMLQQRNLTAEDFGGPALEGCNENLVRTRPDVVLEIHRKYFEAGADIIETNTFGGAPIVLAEYGLADHALFLNRRAAELARQAAEEYSAPSKPRFVAGSMGPTTKAITVTGGVTFEELRNAYYLQPFGLEVVGVTQFFKGDSAGHGDRFGRRTHRSRHEAGFARRAVFLSGLARQFGSAAIQKESVVRQAIFGENDGSAAKGIGLNNIGASLEVLAVNLQHHIGPRAHQIFVAAFQRGTAEVLGGEVSLLQHGPHGAVEHQDALRQ